MGIVSTLMGLTLIGFGVAGILNVRRSRDRIVQINRGRPPGDRSRSVAGITTWCLACVAVGALFVHHGIT